MAAMDVNSLFARAEQAFLARRYDEARRDLAPVLDVAGDHPAVLHLAALVEKNHGAPDAAAGYFTRALAAAPGDVQIRTNYGNLLDAAGRGADALVQYRQAVAGDPRFLPARLGEASALRKLGRQEEALNVLDALLTIDPNHAAAFLARGSLLLERDRPAEAAAMFDRLLATRPDQPRALHGRARAALEMGARDAVRRYRRARAATPGDPDAALGEAQALMVEGRTEEAIALLGAVASARPEWAEGQSQLALMRYEAGDRAGFASHFDIAISARPDDIALQAAHWRSLTQGGLHDEAAARAERMRRHFGDIPDTLLPLASSLMETGAAGQALTLLTPFDDLAEARFMRGRAALITGDPARAAMELERLVAAAPDTINGWAHLDLAWRLMGDPRHPWLSGQEGLFAARDIAMDGDDIAALADLLRSLHTSRAHPIGQSLRGGTQTRGRLFSRPEPLLSRLEAALVDAVHAHRDALPPTDPAHPLLRHRDATLAIKGAWSVRLTGAGFHVSHIHPQGLLSSACYIVVPDGVGSGDPTESGWLQVGAPGPELGLDLAPLASFAPRPGRLVLFPSYLFHGTRPFAAGERMTVAFDVAAR